VTLLRNAPGYITAGLESDAFLSLSLGYYHLIPGNGEKQASLIYGEIQAPVLIALKGEGNHAFRLDAGYQWGGICLERFCVDGQANLFFMNHSTVLGTFRPLGTEIGGSAGIQLGRSCLGLFCEWHHVLAVHISHSDYSRECFSEIPSGGSPFRAPEDGWFSNTGSMIGYGIRYCTPAGKKLLLNIDIGAVSHLSEYTGMLDAMMIGQLPFMLDVKFLYGLHYR
jgi:hypothetical protein